jgi:thiol:disulfide interchange protein DsbD
VRRFFLVIGLMVCGLPACAFAQSESFNHVRWAMTLEPASAAPGSTVIARLEATIDSGWHMYSLSTPPGPIPTTIKTVNGAGIANVTFFEPPPIRKYDENFKVDTETYEGAQVFLARIELKKDLAPGDVTLAFQPRYQTCSGTQCIPPRTRDVSAVLKVVAGAPVSALTIPAGYVEAKPSAPANVGGVAAQAETGLIAFLALAFGSGLAAIFTPCVFPMIPITMSFFTGQRGGLAQALTFCLGIVFLFTSLGMVATLLLGSSGVGQLGSNPWVNGFIAAVFFVFGLSLLGAFEITIPSSVLTRMNAASNAGGYVGSLMMGLTFALASFACVGPFMGTLLAASVQSGKLRPMIGMATFSSGLALPFFLLALFPGWIAKLPRSGEWLSRVKVVMGFIVLAAMMKYLYSLDAVLQTGFLTRERFLATWVVLLGMAGAYLLGFVRLPGISKDDELTVTRLLIGIFLVVGAFTLVPGMFGGRLGDIEAFIPPQAGASGELQWTENDLDGAFAQAKAGGKYVLVNFTGYACTNCHWMKANMFTRPEISGVMKNMVLVDLYTDGTDAASVANQKLEEETFQTAALPFYVLYDPDRNVVATFPQGLTKNSAEFLAFLNTRGSGSQAAQNDSPSIGPFKTLDGAALSVGDWKGKVVVLNYWATWCIPCRAEIPEFNKIHQDLGSKGVQVVGISMDEDGADAVKAFLKDNPMKYTVGLGAGTMDSPLPVTLVLDRNGKTVQKFEGLIKPEEIRAAVAKAQSVG